MAELAETRRRMKLETQQVMELKAKEAKRHSAAAAAAEAATGRYIFTDDSNLWLSAKGRASEFLPKVEGQDPRGRIDLGSVIKVIEEVVVDGPTKQCTLYGSEPPPNDSVWREAKNCGYEVKTFQREYGRVHGREKEVDTALCTDVGAKVVELSKVLQDAAEQDATKIQIVLISGDRDMQPAAKKALEYGFSVTLCAFSSSVATEY